MNHPHRSECSADSFAHTGSLVKSFHADLLPSKPRSWTTSLQLFLTFVVSLAALWGVSGCSTSVANGGSQTPIISVALAQLPPSSLLVGTSTQVSATVTSDVANAGIDWIATCGSTPNCGTFSPSHTASGAISIYTAPPGVPLKNTVAVTALSTTDRSKTSAATVTITSRVTGIVITPPLPASAPAGGVINLGATVDGDPANLGVDWTASCTTASGPVICSPSLLHSAAGGTVAFTVPETVTVPGTGQIQSLVGTSITVTALATADHSFTAMALFTVTAPISINITQAPPATLLTNATAPVTAVVSNDPTNSGVDWIVQCQSTPCGTVTPSHTVSGVAAIYTAPPTVPSPNPPPGFQVTITAYATATGTNLLSSVTLNIVAPVSVKITGGITNSTIVTNASAPLVATVSNDFANMGVDWAVTCGSAGACGTFSPTHTASGGTTTYTAPSAPPAGGTVTITATSTSDQTKSDQQIVTVTSAPPPNSLLQGRFVVFLSARNSQNGPFILGGTISGNGNGTITAGGFDLADAAGNAVAPTGLGVIAPSTYSIGLDGRGQIQLTLNTAALNTSFGVSAPGATTGTLTLSVVFVTPQHALLSETDSFGSAMGTLDLQNAADLASFENGSAGLNGTYSLQLTGTELASPHPDYFVASAATFQASGSSYTLTGYTADQSANGAISSAPFTVTSQVFLNSAPSPNGEIMLSSVNLGLPKQFSLDLWLIDANHFVVTDYQDASGLFTRGPFFLIGGYLTVQPASPSLSGTFAFTEAGATTAAQPQVAGGILSCGSTSTTPGPAGILDVAPLVGAGTPSTTQINATCGVQAHGRSLITISGAGFTGITTFAAYPTSDRGLYLIELDGGSTGTSGPSGAGVALQQTLLPPISASAFNGKYASNFTASTAVGSQVFAAQIISDGVSKVTGAADVNSFATTPTPPAGSPSSNAALGGSFTAGGSGRFPLALTIVPASGQPTPQITILNPACYLVDANTCLLLGLDATAPGTGVLQLQNTGI
jgi:hypothetical protein